MASSEKIDEYIDIPAVTKETDTLLALMEKLLAKKNEVNKVKVTLGQMDKGSDISAQIQALEKQMNELTTVSKSTTDQFIKVADVTEKAVTAAAKYGRVGDTIVQSQKNLVEATMDANEIVKKFSGSIQENIKRQLELKMDLEGVKKSQKDLATQYAGSATSVDSYNAKLAELGETEARIKANISELNITIKQQAKILEANETSIDQYSLTLGSLKDTYRSLSQPERFSEEGKKLFAAIQQLDPAVKGFDESLGNFQRSVGNYAKATANYSGALDILKKAFLDTGSKLSNLSKDQNANKEVVKSLEKEYELLNTLVATQEAGFARAATEIRANKDALLALQQAGLQGTDAYKDLAQATGDLQDQTGDLAAITKQLGSDTFAFDGLIDAASGLAGVYGVAQGAAALFGEENEELQKTFVKLQAVETVLQGLQAISNTLQSESAAILLVQNIRTRALAAAQFLYTTATAAASTATRALRTTLLSSGIGVIVVALGYAVSKLIEFSEATSKSKKEQDALSDAIKSVNDSLNEQAKFASEINQELARGAKDQLAVTEARGASEGKLLQLKKDIAQTDINNSKQSLSDLELTENQIIILQNKKRVALEQLTKAQQLFQEATNQGDEDNIEGLKKNLETRQKDLDAINSRLIPGTEAYNKLLDAQLTLQTLQGNQARFNIGEKQKQLQADREILQLQADAATAAAGNEETSYSARIEALKKFQSVQKSILGSQKQEQLLDPTLSGKQRLLVETQYSTNLVKLKLGTNKQIDDLNREAIQRERAAQAEIVRISLEQTAVVNEEIAANDKKGYEERNRATSVAYLAKRSLIIGQTAFELNNAQLTASERKAIEQKANSQLLDLDRELGKNQVALILENEEKVKAAIEKANQSRQNSIVKSRAEAIKALNETGGNDIEDIQKKETQRALIEEAYRFESIRAEAESIQAKIMTTKAGTDERLELEKDLAEKTMELSDMVAARDKQNAESRVQLVQDLVDSGKELLTTLALAGYDREKNAIQEQIDLLEQKKLKDIEVAQSQTATEEKKAADIAIINARTAAQREQLERQQKEVDIRRAQFEKAIGILQIGVETGASIIKLTAAAAAAKAQAGVLTSNPITAAYAPVALASAAAISAQIPFVLAQGAVQIALIASKPIPKFRTGTKDAPGGLAIVGEERKEVIHYPDGRLAVTPDRPTLVDLPKHSIVYPSMEEARAAINNITNNNLKLQVPQVQPGSDPEMIKAMQKELRAIRSSIDKKPVPKIYNSLGGWRTEWESGRNQWEYINRNMR